MAYRDSNRKCPTCNGALSVVKKRSGVRFHECNGCGGRLLPLADFQALLAEMDPHTPAPIRHMASDEQRRPCPTCKEMMSTVGLYDVVLDECWDHGIWFDPSELQTTLMRHGPGAESE